MLRARLVLAVGVLLWTGGFALGTEPRSVVVGGHLSSCGSPLPMSWLVPGATGPAEGESGATAGERRACSGSIAEGRWLSGGALGLGALLGLVGWTAGRELGDRPVDAGARDGVPTSA